MTNTLWQDRVTRKPPSTRSSTRETRLPLCSSTSEERTTFTPSTLRITAGAEVHIWKSYLLGINGDVNLRILFAGKKFHFFFVLFILEGLFLPFFCLSGASFLWTSLCRRPVKCVHIGLNKRHFIYTIKISIYFHVPGVLVMICFLAHSVECGGIVAAVRNIVDFLTIWSFWFAWSTFGRPTFFFPEVKQRSMKLVSRTFCRVVTWPFITVLLPDHENVAWLDHIQDQVGRYNSGRRDGCTFDC